ncbi:MAG TPA: cation:proton antiporter [Candidatus Coprenecus pullistercoris]|nr:cation:proton antiporter [Candidatus Coprenecus pullistercoris]
MDWFKLNLPITDPTWIFLIVLMIILFAPLLFNRLRIPNIIGMILAGVLIGEHGLNLLARDSSFELFGNVGLYYIMLLAGLNINMGDFKRNRKKAAVLGLLTFLVPITLGFVINLSFLRYGVATSILLASMYASYTLISYPIVLRLGVSRQRSVSIAVGATAVTDTLTLLVLAVISGIFHGGSGEMFWITMAVKVVATGAVILYTFPRIARWFFRKYDDTVMQFIFVLVMLFLAAGLMEIAGLEGILGAFITGLLLNRLIPNISPLKSHIEFVGNALFIPFFLIGVGMLINLNVIFGDGDALKVAAVMTATALCGKWIACLITQKTFRMSGNERRLMFGLSTSQAAATLAAALIGHEIVLPDGSPLLDEDVLNGTILLILVTCIVSSLVTENASKKAALEEPLSSPGPDERAEKILIPLANPDTVNDLVCMSMAIRDQRLSDNLYALSIIYDNDNANAISTSQRNLENAARTAASAHVELKKLSRYDINIASGIIHTVKEQDISSVIIGLRRDGDIKSPILGNLAVNLLRGLHCEIMVMRLMVPINTLRKILIAVPPKAEYEAGFRIWVEQVCRMGMSLGRSLDFHASQETVSVLKPMISETFKSIETSYTVMPDLSSLPSLAPELSMDTLLIVVSSRHGSISHDNTLDKLPKLLARDFPHTSLILLYPEKFDDSGHSMNIN